MQKLRFKIFATLFVVYFLGISQVYCFSEDYDTLNGHVVSYEQFYFTATEKNGLIVKGTWNDDLPYNFELEIKDGKWVTMKRYMDGGGEVVSYENFLYDYMNRLSGTHLMGRDYSFIKKVNYIRSSSGDLSKIETTDYHDHHLNGSVVYNYYPEQDSLIEEFFNENGELQKVVIKKSGEENYLVLEKTYDAEFNLDRVQVYVYNSKGRLSYETCYNGFGHIDYTRRYHYDNFGSIILDEKYGPDKTVWHSIKRELSYDTYGNWIHMNHFEDGEPLYMIQREINYK